MNREIVEVLKQFIQTYEAFNDKEAFINMWKDILNNIDDDVTLTIADAYNEVYGNALVQVYAIDEEGVWIM